MNPISLYYDGNQSTRKSFITLAAGRGTSATKPRNVATTVSNQGSLLYRQGKPTPDPCSEFIRWQRLGFERTQTTATQRCGSSTSAVLIAGLLPTGKANRPLIPSTSDHRFGHTYVMKQQLHPHRKESEDQRMKIAYLILAHRNPQLIKRAIDRLSTKDCAFFIHIDQKSDLRRFSRCNGNNVSFCEHRIPVYWGEFSQVEATLLLMSQAINHAHHFDYFILMSGSDYPLKSGEYIQEFLDRHRGEEFLNLAKLPAPGFPLYKINKVRHPSDQPVRRFFTRALGKIGFARRDFRKSLGGMAPYCGSTWWALSRDAIEYILQFDASHPQFAKYFRDTFTSDEMFFHTILGNSDFRDRIRRNLVYLDWSDGGNHPADLGEEHLDLFEKQERIMVKDEWGCGEALFARKFSDEGLAVIDRLDQIILRKDRNLTSTKSAALTE